MADDLDDVVFDERFVAGATNLEPAASERIPRPAPTSRPRRQRLRLELSGTARWTLIAAGVLAVLFGLLTLLDMQGAREREKQTASQGETGIYGPGDCVTWPATSSGLVSLIGTHVVPCAEPHRLEVVGTRRLSDEMDPTSPTFATRTTAMCAALVTERAGVRLDRTQHEILTLRPTIDSWRSGDRLLWCGITSAGRDPDTGDVAEMRGAVLGP